MTWWEAILLGLVQGLTEFLPISSSAHLRIVGELLPSGADPGAAFTAITQSGTEAAVLVYFRKDITRIISHWFKSLPVGPWRRQVSTDDPDARMGWLIILGSLPIVIAGLTFADTIEYALRNLYITAAVLALFALILGWADRIGAKRRTLDQLTWKHGLLYGLAQAMALIPGVSRSGGTITAGLLMGYTRQAAARYAFLLAVPAVFASGLYKAAQEVPALLTADGRAAAAAAGEPSLLAIVVATAVAFVVGYAVIVWFMRVIETRSYMMFVIYRVVAGVVLLALL